MSKAAYIIDRFSGGNTVFDDHISFKTLGGFEHWYMRSRQMKKPYNGKVKVDGKMYKSPDEVIKINKLNV